MNLIARSPKRMRPTGCTRWTIAALRASLLALGLLLPGRAAAILVPCPVLRPVSSTIPADAAGLLLVSYGDRSGFAPRLLNPNGVTVEAALVDFGPYILLDPVTGLFPGTFTFLWTRTCGPGTNGADPVEVATPIEVTGDFVSPDSGVIQAELQKCGPDLQQWALSWQPSPEIATRPEDYWFSWEVDGQAVVAPREILIVVTTEVMGTKWQDATQLQARNAQPTIACAGVGSASTRTARLRLFHLPSAREVMGIEHTFDVSCTRCALPPGVGGTAATAVVPLVGGTSGGCTIGAARPTGFVSAAAFAFIGWRLLRRHRRRPRTDPWV